MPSPICGNIKITRPSHLDENEIASICAEINAIYLEEEKDIWPHDGSYYRINASLLKNYLHNFEIFILREDNVIASIIRLYYQDGKRYFGLLSSFRNYRRRGYAKLLVEHVESVALKDGDPALWIELLYCKELTLDNKTRLFDWYSSLGYEKYEIVDFLSVHPEKKDVLQRACDFHIMRKLLR